MSERKSLEARRDAFLVAYLCWVSAPPLSREKLWEEYVKARDEWAGPGYWTQLVRRELLDDYPMLKAGHA